MSQMEPCQMDRWSEAGQDTFAGEEKVAWSPPSGHPVAEGGATGKPESHSSSGAAVIGQRVMASG